MAYPHDGLHLIPQHMHEPVLGWIYRRQPIGKFLNAVLSNDFMGAATNADEANLAKLRGWAHFLYNYAPRGCYGSPEKVEAWKGLDYYEKEGGR